MTTDIARAHILASNATNEAICMPNRPMSCTRRSVKLRLGWRFLARPCSARSRNQSAALCRRIWAVRRRSPASQHQHFESLRLEHRRCLCPEGQAFRDRKICVSNDFLNGTHARCLGEGAGAGQIGAAAGLPICNGESVGVLLVSRREPHSIDGQIAAMLDRVSANISFALDNSICEAGRASGERAAAAEPRECPA